MAQLHSNRGPDTTARGSRTGFAALLLCGIALSACAGGGTAPLEASFSVQPANAADPDAFDEGMAHLKAGRNGKAAELLEQAQLAHPEDLRVLNALATAYDRMGRHDLALRLYHRALAREPDDPQTLNNIGYSYLMQERVDLAISYLGVAEETLAARGDAESERLGRVRVNLAQAEAAKQASPAAMAFAASGIDPHEAETIRKNISLPHLLRGSETVQHLLTRGESLADTPGVTHDLSEAAARDAAGGQPARRPPTLALVTRSDRPAEETSPASRDAIGPASVELSNGAGLRGMAASLRRHLRAHGIAVARLTNADRFSYAETTVFFRPGHGEAAAALAKDLGVAAATEPSPGQRSDLRVRLGGDLVPFARQLQSQETESLS